MKNKIPVLYFGGTTMTLVVAEPVAGGTFSIRNRASLPFSGIVGGEFVDPTELGGIFKELVYNAFSGGGVRIDKLFVGAPPEFCQCTVRDAHTQFERPTKINQSHIRQLTDGVVFETDGTIINKSAVFFRINDSHPMTCALGQTARKLSAQFSAISCDEYFIETVRKQLSKGAVSRLEFISNNLAEAIYLIDEETRDRTCTLISSGMFSTTVSVVSGDGIVYKDSFAMGLAHVIDDVSQVKKIEFDLAKVLTSEAVLSVNMGKEDNYEIANHGLRQKFPAALINDVIKARLEEIAIQIAESIKHADAKLINNPIFITGGHLDNIKGAKDYFSKLLSVHVRQCLCPLTRQVKPDELTLKSLVNLAMRQQTI